MREEERSVAEKMERDEKESRGEKRRRMRAVGVEVEGE